MNIRLSDDPTDINWEALAVVFHRAPLGERKPEKLREAFTRSPVRCFVWDDDRLIGAGRALTDGVTFAAVFDVVLLPEYQRKGIGSRIMEHLAAASKAPNAILHAVPGKEAFYRQLGFRKMTTAMARFSNPEKQREQGYIE
jgi:predicted N-acetyltransferase YhbS